MSKPSIYIKVPCPECEGRGFQEITQLAALRKKAGLDQAEVAESLGLTRTSISNFERGIQSISIDKVAPLAKLYGVNEYEMYDVAKALFFKQGILNKEDSKAGEARE